jgi:sorbitol/mannitol transport system substrate-binding protein
MSYPRFKFRALGAAACIAATAVVAACSSGGAGGSNASGVVTVAVVSNPLITSQMEPLTRSVFQKQHPGITVKFATYTEGDLRAAIEKDVSTHSNSFNVIMIGPYETPLFAKNGWLTNLSSQFIAKDPGYDASDLLPPIAKALSYKGSLYAVPFYGESSMVFYRKDLFAKAGLTMPLHPTWAQIQASRAGVTTWPPSTPSSTPSAASGSTCTGSRSSPRQRSRRRPASTSTLSVSTASPAPPTTASTSC